MSTHDFCRGDLKSARYEAKGKGIKIPNLSSSKMFDEHYAVFLGNDWYQEFGACCAYNARFQALSEFINEQEEKAKKE